MDNDIRFSTIRKYPNLIPIACYESEIFKDFPFDTRYKVSNFGRVYDKQLNSIILPYTERNGYLRISINHSKYSIHRMVMITFNPVDGYEDLQVNHINGNKLDNRTSNLEWCTSKENVNHAFRIGLHKIYYGDNALNSKVSEKFVHQICEFMKMGYKDDYHKLCELLGVEYCDHYCNLFYHIKSHKAWSYIAEQYGI